MSIHTPVPVKVRSCADSVIAASAGFYTGRMTSDLAVIPAIHKLNRLERIGLQALVQSQLSVRPKIARALVALLDHAGECVPDDRLVLFMGSFGDSTPSGRLTSPMCVLRGALADIGIPDAIERSSREGYAINRRTAARIWEALGL